MSKKTPEKIVQDDIIDYIKELKKLNHPIDFERRQAGGFNYKKGKPDLFIIYNGIHIELEVKAPGGKQTPLQIKFEKKCKNKNICPYMCIDSLEKFIEELWKIIK